jgi:hypothetical protein
MIKFKIDSIAEAKKDGEPHTVYVQLYDDETPDVKLANICVAYEDDKQFQDALQAKAGKYLESVITQSLLREKVEAILPQAETAIDATRADIVVQKTAILQKTKEMP